MFVRLTTLVLLATGIGCVLGCGSSTPSPSDPEVGRETLKSALDAWKRGDSITALKEATPSVTVVDHQWQKGAKLLDFEIAGDSQPDGYDVQFKTKLTVQMPDGKTSKQKAAYNVSTTPARVVVRAAE